MLQEGIAFCSKKSIGVLSSTVRNVTGMIAVADIGRKGLVEAVAEAAIELSGQVAVRAGADIAVTIGEEARAWRGPAKPRL